MLRFLFMAALLALAGCGAIDSVRGDQGTDFVIGSCFESGLVPASFYADIRGGKLTFHGIEDGIRYRLSMREDGTCNLEVWTPDDGAPSETP